MKNEVIEQLNEIVELLMKEKEINKYDINIEGITESGENYMGDLIFFKVIPQNGEKTFDFVMKTAKRSDDLRKNVPLEASYNRELYVYNKVFPAFREFLEEKNCPFKFDIVPQVHYTCQEPKKETLILTDLKSEGYKLWDRTKAWNMKHILKLMEYYGKFHGVSFALRDQKPEIFAKLTEPMNNLNSEFNKVMDTFQFYNEPYLKVMALFKECGRLDLVEKYEGFEKYVDFAVKCDTDEVDKVVICHGDGWNNNFMFKYNSRHEPSTLCFLDFQFSFIDSPILDLSMSIYSSCDRSCLDNFELILRTYHEALSDTVRSLGSDPEKLFPYEKLWDDWKKYGKFGVIISCIFVKILLSSKEDAPDLQKGCEEGKNFDQSFQFQISNAEEYKKRMIDVFEHFANMFM